MKVITVKKFGQTIGRFASIREAGEWMATNYEFGMCGYDEFGTPKVFVRWSNKKNKYVTKVF